LCSASLIEIVRRAGAAHAGRHPSRLQGVREHVRPTAGDGEGDENVVQLALRVGLGRSPGAFFPQEVVDVRRRAAVHAGTQVDEPLRPLDQRGQDIGRERVDGEDLGKPVLGLDASMDVADGGEDL
jgi:hypothetical protein